MSIFQNFRLEWKLDFISFVSLVRLKFQKYHLNDSNLDLEHTPKVSKIHYIEIHVAKISFLNKTWLPQWDKLHHHLLLTQVNVLFKKSLDEKISFTSIIILEVSSKKLLFGSFDVARLKDCGQRAPIKVSWCYFWRCNYGLILSSPFEEEQKIG